ncbi:hypothetical protein V6N13_118504 [Hibiscus sabdariffa]
MSGGGASGRELDQTPTWAVAVVCAVIIIISIALEKVLHTVGEIFEHKKKEALYEALEKVKGELMVLGFISLLLTFGQSYISQICIPDEVADTMLFCPKKHAHGEGHGEGEGHGNQEEGSGHGAQAEGEEHHRRLLFYADARRFLSGAESSAACGKVRSAESSGYVSFVAPNFLTKPVVIVLQGHEAGRNGSGSVSIVLMNSTSGIMGYGSDLSPFGCPWLAYYDCHRHDSSGVGTKLQAIIAQMALEIVEKHAVIQGMPLVQVSDEHFWFGWPPLVLHLLHFVLFQNAFEITYFFWIWYEFGLRSCFHQDFTLITIRVFLGVLVQFICSYITLPLYALVTQMGSTMKRSIFDEQTSKALKQWHKKAAQKTGDHTHGKTEASGHHKKENGADGSSMEHGHSGSVDANAEGKQKSNTTGNVDLLTGP